MEKLYRLYMYISSDGDYQIYNRENRSIFSKDEMQCCIEQRAVMVDRIYKDFDKLQNDKKSVLQYVIDNIESKNCVRSDALSMLEYLKILRDRTYVEYEYTDYEYSQDIGNSELKIEWKKCELH